MQRSLQAILVVVVLFLAKATQVSAQTEKILQSNEYDAAATGAGVTIGGGTRYLFPIQDSVPGPAFVSWSAELQHALTDRWAMRAQCGRDYSLAPAEGVYVPFRDVRRCTLDAAFYTDPWLDTRMRGYFAAGAGLYRYRLFAEGDSFDNALPYHDPVRRVGVNAVAGVAQPSGHVVALAEIAVHLYAGPPQWTINVGLRWQVKPM